MSLDTLNREPENLNALPDNERESFTGYGEYSYSYTAIIDYKIVGDFENGIFKRGKVERKSGYLDTHRGSVIETLEGDFFNSNQKVSTNYHPVLTHGTQTQVGIEDGESITVNDGEFGADPKKRAYDNWCLKNGIRVKSDGARVVVQNFEEVPDRRAGDTELAKKIDRGVFIDLNEVDPPEREHFTGKGRFSYYDAQNKHARLEIEGEWLDGYFISGTCKRIFETTSEEIISEGKFRVRHGGSKTLSFGPSLESGRRTFLNGLFETKEYEEGEFLNIGWLKEGKQKFNDGTVKEGVFENTNTSGGYWFELKEGTITKRDGTIVQVRDFKEVEEPRSAETKKIDLDNVRLGNFYEILGNAGDTERSGSYTFGCYGAVTNRGEGYKDHNEDRVVVSEIIDEEGEVIGLQIVVIDGMGGHGGGELAAKILAEEFTKGGTFEQILDRTKERYRREPSINRNDRRFDGGTCWVAVRVIGNKAKRAHMGDARLSSWNKNGDFKFKTKDEGYGRFVNNPLQPNDGDLVKVEEFDLEEGDTLALRSDGVTDNFEESEEIDIMAGQPALVAARGVKNSVLMRQNGTYTGRASLDMKPDNISDVVYVHGKTNIVAYNIVTTGGSSETLDTKDDLSEAATRESYSKDYISYANLREALVRGTLVRSGHNYELVPGFVDYSGNSAVILRNVSSSNFAAYSTNPDHEGLVYIHYNGYLYRGNQVRKGDTFVREGFGSLINTDTGSEQVGEWHDNILVRGFKTIPTSDGLIKCKVIDNTIIEENVGEFKGEERKEFTGCGYIQSGPYSYNGYWLNGVSHGEGEFEDYKKKIRRVGIFRKGEFVEGKEMDAAGNVTEYKDGKPVVASSGATAEDVASEFDEPLSEGVINLNERPDGTKGFTGIGRYENYGIIYTGPWVNGVRDGINGREENIPFNEVREGEWKEGIFWSGTSTRDWHDGNISFEVYRNGRIESSTVGLKSEEIAPIVESEADETQELSGVSSKTRRLVGGLAATAGAALMAAGVGGVVYNLNKLEEERVKTPEYSDVTGIDDVGSKLVAELDKTNPDTSKLKKLIAEAEEKIRYVDTTEEGQAVTALELFKKVAEKKIEVLEATTTQPTETPVTPQTETPSRPNSSTPPPGGVTSPF